MYLSPVVAVPTPLGPAVAASLAASLRKIEEEDDVTAVSQDLAGRFPPPDRVDPAAELGATLSGRGLFGNSDVWVTESPSRVAAEMLRKRAEQQPAASLWAEKGPA